MAGTITQAHYKGDHINRLEFACTADAEDASFPDTVITTPIEGWLTDIEANPGTTSPTNNYDITIEDGEGHDVLEACGANKPMVLTHKTRIIYSGENLHPIVDRNDTLTLKIANNSVNSATVKIILYYMSGK